MRRIIGVLAAGLFLPSLNSSQACTTVALRNQSEKMVGKTYDWDIEDAFVITNKKNVKKKSLVFERGQVATTWMSKYNSVTFNQYGREFPNSGMNETGLVVEVMVLDTSKFPDSDRRPVINETQIVQQVLDTAASVDEALPMFSASRMSPVMVHLHYLICDLNECAVVEYRDGTEMVYQGDDAPYLALANHDYDQSLEHLALYKGFGGTRDVPDRSTDSLRRFVIAASASQSFQATRSDRPLEVAFQQLKRVETGGTQWVILYDQARKLVNFKTRSGQAVKTFNADASGPLMSGSCKDQIKVLPVVSAAGGDQTRAFRPYSASENAAMIRRHLTGQVPAAVVSAAVAYPDAQACLD